MMRSALTREYTERTVVNKTSLNISNKVTEREILKPTKALSVMAFTLDFGFGQNFMRFFGF